MSQIAIRGCPGLGYGNTDLDPAQRAAGDGSQGSEALHRLHFSGWGLTRPSPSLGEAENHQAEALKEGFGRFSVPCQGGAWTQCLPLFPHRPRGQYLKDRLRLVPA